MCGPGECTAREWDLAYRTGRLLAGRGAVVIRGGPGGVTAAVEATGLRGRGAAG